MIRYLLIIVAASLLTFSNQRADFQQSQDHKDHDHKHDHVHKHDHDHSHDKREVDHSKDHSEDESVLAILKSMLPGMHVHKDGGGCCGGNKHKKLIQALIKASNADKLIDVLDKVMRPLPKNVQATVSTLSIQIIPVFLVYILSSMSGLISNSSKDIGMKYAISFAIGGLLGDVFFHTLPHMNAGEGHGHSHDHSSDEKAKGGEHAGHDHGHEGHGHDDEQIQTNFIIILGILAFFLIERLTQSILAGDHNPHKHNHGSDKKVKDSKVEKKKTQEEILEEEKKIKLQSFAIISMIGDFIHNFTDGLSIGVAYQADYKIGVTTTIAMFFHEIPHEVGDFALLFQLNYSICQILALQLITSLGALAGSIVGAYIGNVYMKETLAFTSGGFLYFAINGLLGELKEVKKFDHLVNCMMLIILGCYSMYIFGLFE